MNPKNTEDLIQSLSQEVTPVKPMGREPLQAGLWFFVSCAIIATSFAFKHTRWDFALKLQDASFVKTGLVLLIDSLALIFTAVWFSIPGRRGQLAFAFVSSVILAIFTGTALGHAFNFADFSPITTLEFSEMHCALLSIIMGAAPLVALMSLCRKLAPVKPGITGAWIGLASATGTAVAMSMICDKDHPAHLLGWHYLTPFLFLGGLGFFLGRKILRW